MITTAIRCTETNRMYAYNVWMYALTTYTQLHIRAVLPTNCSLFPNVCRVSLSLQHRISYSDRQLTTNLLDTRRSLHYMKTWIHCIYRENIEIQYQTRRIWENMDFLHCKTFDFLGSLMCMNVYLVCVHCTNVLLNAIEWFGLLFAFSR